MKIDSLLVTFGKAHINNPKNPLSACEIRHPSMYEPWVFTHCSRAMNQLGCPAIQKAVWQQGNAKWVILGADDTLNFSYCALMWREEGSPKEIRRLLLQSVLQIKKGGGEEVMKHQPNMFDIDTGSEKGWLLKKKKSKQPSLVTWCEELKWQF